MLGLLMPLAGLLGLELDDLGKRARGLIAAYVIIGLFSAIGIGFLIAAGFIALSNALGALTAAMIMAAAFLAVALLVYLAMSIGENARRRRLAERKKSSDAGAFLTTAALTALPVLAKTPTLVKLGVPAAALAALALMRDRGRPDA